MNRAFLCTAAVAAVRWVVLSRAAAAAVSLEPIAYRHSTNAWLLRNAEVEVVVAPEIGRIVRYGFAGGSNVLWSGCTAAGPWIGGTWTNWGGDKAWVWPQDGWPARIGRKWPPPGDGAAHGAEGHPGGSGLRLTGPEIEGHGCRIVREIALAPTGTALSIVTRLEAVGAASLDGLAAWTVTQVPAVREVTARLAADATGDGVHDPVRGWPAPLRDGRTLRFQRTGGSCKSFVDADRLSVILGSVRFTVEAIPVAGGSCQPGERAQIYSSPEDDRWRPAEVGPYIELEFTSPRASAGQRTVGFTVVWTLERLRPGP